MSAALEAPGQLCLHVCFVRDHAHLCRFARYNGSSSFWKRQGLNYLMFLHVIFFE